MLLFFLTLFPYLCFCADVAFDLVDMIERQKAEDEHLAPDQKVHNFTEHDLDLFQIVLEGKVGLVKKALDSGANVCLEDILGCSVLLIAISRQPKELIKLLIDSGSDINRPTNSGQTPLMQAVLYSREKIVKRLIKMGAEVNAQNSFGETALMYAVKNGDRNIAEMLLGGGADVEVVDKFGDDAFSWIHPDNHEKLFHFLALHKKRVYKGPTRPLGVDVRRRENVREIEAYDM